MLQQSRAPSRILGRDLTPLASLTGAPDETMLMPKELAALIRRTTVTLRTWRKEGKGPTCVVVGGRPLYPLGAVRRWARGEAA